MVCSADGPGNHHWLQAFTRKMVKSKHIPLSSLCFRWGTHFNGLSVTVLISNHRWQQIYILSSPPGSIDGFVQNAVPPWYQRYHLTIPPHRVRCLLSACEANPKGITHVLNVSDMYVLPPGSSTNLVSEWVSWIIELDDGKIYRKHQETTIFDGKHHGFL